ncbi:MAG: serine/threonine-protein kinase [Planctomycetota bacterium]|nr:serine/threonine-protein kinase [Planctomycetota bacterium]
MACKLQWSANDEDGIFAIRGGVLHAIWEDEGFDSVFRSLGKEEAGFIATLAAQGSKVELVASGKLRFLSKGKEFQKVVLPSGARLKFSIEGELGTLNFQGREQESDENIGQELNGYKILGHLGAGAVGKVYRAKQIALDRDVALKVLKPEAAQNPKAVTSFQREAVAAGRLSHPNLVPVFDVGESKGLHYYSMELVPGGTLEEYLKEHGPFHWRQAVHAAIDCAYALSFAEEHHLIHRDVKPENLMFTSDETVKLADLGLSATRGMLDQEAAGGTPHFMAPEIAQKKNVDHRSDLYSLGCTLFRLITGETVFEGQSLREILLAHAQEEPPTLAEFGCKVPKGLEKLLSSLLSKDPNDRPQSAQEVADSLEDVLKAQTRKRGKLLVLAVLLGSAGWLLKPTPEEVSPETIVKEVLVQDPSVAETQAQLEATKIRLVLANVKAISDLSEKKEALAQFIQEQPQGPWLEEAQSLLSETETLLSKETNVAPTDPFAEVLSQAQAQIQEAVALQHYSEALSIPAASLSLPEEARLELEAYVHGLLAIALSAKTNTHSEFLDASSFAAAKELREGTQMSLGTYRDRYSDLFAKWETSEKAAEAAMSSRVSQDARKAFLSVLHADFASSLSRWEFDAARLAYQRACQALPPSSSILETESFHQTLADALSVSQLIRARLENKEGVFFQLPSNGKRVQLLSILPSGLELETQSRGSKKIVVLPFGEVNRPRVLTAFLEAATSDWLPPENAHAFFILLGANRLGAEVYNWGSELPPAELLSQWAQEAHDWASTFPTHLPLRQPHLRNEVSSFLLVEAIAQQLSENRSWEALSLLQALKGQLSWTSILSSNGSRKWGLSK